MEKINHNQHKFFIAGVVFLMMVVGIIIATKFKEVSLGIINIVLLLVISLLLLFIISILFVLNENLAEKNEKRGR